MRSSYLLGLIPALLGSPALAHHESLVLTALPSALILLAALPVAGWAAWLRHRRRRRNKRD